MINKWDLIKLQYSKDSTLPSGEETHRVGENSHNFACDGGLIP